MIIIIAAVATNKVIGRDNKMPWKITDDLADFKKITLGKTVIMGRKTYESIGKKLKNRTIIVISRNKEFLDKEIMVAHSKEEAINLTPKNKNIYIAGGEKIYKMFLDIADEIRITKVHQEFEGDTFFPEISKNDWGLFKESKIMTDVKSGLNFSVEVYRKK